MRHHGKSKHLNSSKSRRDWIRSVAGVSGAAVSLPTLSTLGAILVPDVGAQSSLSIVGNPVWLDDFVGAAIGNKYLISNSGGGTTVIAPNVRGGAALLSTTTTQSGVTRLRFGGDPGTGDPVDVRNWNVNQDIVYETRFLFNSTNYMQSSIGFAGLNDPNNFLEFYYSAPNANVNTWKFAISANNPNGTFLETGFTHPLSQWVVFRIETTRGTPPIVRFYINNILIGSFSAVQIPTTNLVPEYNCYNFPKDGQWSLVGLWVDYLYVSQSRT